MVNAYSELLVMLDIFMYLGCSLLTFKTYYSCFSLFTILFWKLEWIFSVACFDRLDLEATFFFWIKGNFFCWKETKYLPSTIISVHLMLSPLIIFCFSKKKKKIQLYNIICPILFKSFHDSWVEFMILVAQGLRPL